MWTTRLVQDGQQIQVHEVHSKLHSITPVVIKVHVTLQSFVVLTWMCDTIELVWHVTLCNLTLLSPPVGCGPLHLAFRAMWNIHAPIFNKWHRKEKKNKKKKVTLHILTHDAMQGCGLTSLVVCINDKIRDIRERNVTIKSEFWSTNIHSLGLRDVREWVILWMLILRSLGCSTFPYHLWSSYEFLLHCQNEDSRSFQLCWLSNLE